MPNEISAGEGKVSYLFPSVTAGTPTPTGPPGTSGGGSGGDGRMESKIAKLESDVGHMKDDIGFIKHLTIYGGIGAFLLTASMIIGLWGWLDGKLDRVNTQFTSVKSELHVVEKNMIGVQHSLIGFERSIESLHYAVLIAIEKEPSKPTITTNTK